MKKSWHFISTITGLSKNGDCYIARAPSGKVIFVTKPYDDKVVIGNHYPIRVVTEKERVMFGCIEPAIIVDGRYIFFPIHMDVPWDDDQELGRWIERRMIWENAENKLRREEAKEYRRKFDAYRERIRSVIDIRSGVMTGNHTAKYRMLVPELSDEDREAIIFVHGLPPWGVTVGNGWLHTDSYTD